MSQHGHLRPERLLDEAAEPLSAAERAHLDQCPACRVSVRLLKGVAGVDAYLTPGIERARTLFPTLEQQIRVSLSGALDSTIVSEPAATRLASRLSWSQFERARWLGSGQTGVVFQSRDPLTKKPCALKALRVRDGDWLDRFQRSFDAIAELNHPNLIGLRRRSTSGEPAFFTMDLLEGVDVVGAIRGNLGAESEPGADWSPAQLHNCLRQLVEGLLAIHGAGHVHGNLKPSNAVVDANGRLVLLDAGLGWPPGAPRSPYTAPEVCQHDGLTQAADWFSVGTILLESLGSPTHISRAPTPDQPAANRIIPTAGGGDTLGRLHGLIADLTHPDPRQRPTGEAVLARVSTILGGTRLTPEWGWSATAVIARPVHDTVVDSHNGRSGQAAPAADDLLDQTIPVQIGAYRIVEQIGYGAMGVVFLAEHVQTGARVALKTVRVPRESLVASIRREIRHLSRIEHPGVVRIVDQGMHAGVPWYAMAYLRGTTLSESPLIRAWEACDPGALGPVLGLVRGICDALSHLHAAGLVHRDLKPDNVVIDETGLPVIVDLGLVAHFSGKINREVLDLYPNMAGTVPYMSPEQIFGKLVDARADLYAVGCILYELLTGRWPFVGVSTDEILDQHLFQPADPPSRYAAAIPAELDTLILRLLAKHPRDRLGYARDVVAALDALGADGPMASVGRKAADYLYRSELVGRQDAVEHFEKRLGTLETGDGGLLLVTGERGVGRTRLVMEVAAKAAATGLAVHVGSCQREHRDPLGPFRRSLQSMADSCRELGESVTRRLFGHHGAALAEFEPSIARLPGLDTRPLSLVPPKLARERILRALRQTYGTMVSTLGPLVLVLDDLQWADELSLEFLELFSRSETATWPLLIVGTYRSEEAPERLRALVEEGLVEVMDVKRLPEADVGDMVATMLALPDPPASLVRFLTTHSAGNPYFVAEYLNAALLEGWLVRNRLGRWQVSATDAARDGYRSLPVPSSVRDLVDRRLSALPEQSRALAAAAAVLGPLLAPEPLVRVYGGEVNESVELQELLNRGVLEETESGELRFTHAQVATAAYDAIADPERSALHGATARVIEALPEDQRPAHLGELVHHWERAGEPTRALPYYLRAARWAASHYSYRDAERLYRDFIRLDDAPTGDRIRARYELAKDVLSFTGRKREAVVELRAGVEIARAVGDRAQMAHCRRRLGVVLSDIGEMKEAQTQCEAAIELYRALGDREREGEALSNLASVHWRQGHREARELYEQALMMHRLTEDRRSTCTTLNNLALIHESRGAVESAIALFTEALEVIRSIENRAYEGIVLSNLAMTQLNRGSLHEALPLFELSLAIHAEVGNRRSEGIAMTNLCELLVESDRLDEARARAQSALLIHREVQNRRFEGITLADIGEIDLLMGDMESARHHLVAALDIHHSLGDRDAQVKTLRLTASLDRQTGRLAAAETALSKAEVILSEQHRARDALLCAIESGWLALANGEDATRHLHQARRMAADLDLAPSSSGLREISRLESGVTQAQQSGQS